MQMFFIIIYAEIQSLLLKLNANFSPFFDKRKQKRQIHDHRCLFSFSAILLLLLFSRFIMLYETDSLT